ncbi:WhiB family transcriptional regulator [Dietzia sp. SLG310A2-38A2]|uniref:WhiB family transcriptional regulator n=1 Tax=Dietzia sp. SLG310A2-38A2 TaxID=1630643 RepID=UPI0015F97D23|nr:WhiB family transcriptional regulator [Dietzia sp. SLG310A2-38A2]MBB1029695.1 WhiB family transcriptional regulator [Dietzia sp. SLG310A2-38A2]
MTTATRRIDEGWAWAEHGMCQDVPDLFYNAENESKSLRRRKETAAKKLCAQCPVIEQCRAHAVAHRELYGVWGGMSEADRHRLAGRVRTG